MGKRAGEKSSNVAITLNNLAALYQAQGNYKLALPLCKKSLKITEGALGKNHPDVANSLHNLAKLYDVQGDTEAPCLYISGL